MLHLRHPVYGVAACGAGKDVWCGDTPTCLRCAQWKPGVRGEVHCRVAFESMQPLSTGDSFSMTYDDVRCTMVATESMTLVSWEQYENGDFAVITHGGTRWMLDIR